MAKTNVAKRYPAVKTHEGGSARQVGAEAQLRRSVMACLLWEKTFYEDGVEIADRIKSLVPKVDPEKVADMALMARGPMKLRHAPLLLVRELARHPEIKDHNGLVAETLENVIQRADELAEFLALYWKEKKQPLSAQVKKGLAAAFLKFDEYDLAKYNRDGAVKMRDVLFLSHAKPKNKSQGKLWKRLVDGELKVPDTWEVALSAGKDKKETWERLMSEERLGAMALLRNLRNMKEAKVDKKTIRKALGAIKTERVLPHRFIAAARHAPEWEPELEIAMFQSIQNIPKIKGHTVILVDVSGSMDSAVSDKSEMKRFDAAAGLAVLAREMCEQVDIYVFSDYVKSVPARRGFALRDAICNAPHGGTYLGKAITHVGGEDYDRIIVFTDEQSADAVPNPKGKGYMVNVAAYKNGVGYGKWIHMDGFSDHILRYIYETEIGD